MARALAVVPRAADQALLQALRQLQQLGQAQETIEHLQRQYLAVEKLFTPNLPPPSSSLPHRRTRSDQRLSQVRSQAQNQVMKREP